MEMKMCVPCMFGLEGLAGDELKRLGAADVDVRNGTVRFSGDMNTLAAVSIGLSVAERVLILLGEFPANSFEELFQGVKACALEDFIGRTDAFPVKGHSLNSKLKSIPDCQSIIKKAAVERLKQHYHVDWFEETGSLHQIQFSIMNDVASIYLDTSGLGLHKRGYRKTAGEAPIKETLAAGIVTLARVRPNSVVYDPMCGSGTLLIEAAYNAMRIAPGLGRSYACEKWGQEYADAFKLRREQAAARVNREAAFEAWGADIDTECIGLARDNIKKAGVSGRVRVNPGDMAMFAPTKPGIVVCNPPYGERLMDVKRARELYKLLGQRCLREDLSVCVISPDDEFEEHFGRKADKRRKLYNGMLRCQLFMYFSR